MRTKNKQWNKVRKQLGRELARFADQEQAWLEDELAKLMERAQDRYGASKSQVAEELVRQLDRYQASANKFMEGVKERLQPERKRERNNRPWVVLAALMGVILLGRWLWQHKQQLLPSQQTTE